MNTHWTARSTEDFRFRIAADFIAQLEDKMESVPLTQKELAKKLGLSKGRISQLLNDPGNLTLKKIVEYSRALDMKVAITAYEDDDPENRKGPINSEIFKICWEKAGKPRDFWSLERRGEQNQIDENHAIVMTALPVNKDVHIHYEPMPEIEVYGQTTLTKKA